MPFDINNLVRPNVATLKPYTSARSEFDGEASVFLDANENAFGSIVGPDFSRYPDPLQSEVKSLMAELIGVRPSQIFLGNGSDEAIDLLIRIFCRPGVDDVLICPPTYGMYEVSAAINDVAVRRANLTPDFDLDVDAVLETVGENTKIVFLCSPNNPTGNLLKRESMLAVARSFDGIVVVDEAYIHYAEAASVVSELDAYPNLVVLQTFSKAWGLAGLRVGAAFASDGIISLLNKVKPPYNVGQYAQDAAVNALTNKPRLDRVVEETLAERRRLETKFPYFEFTKEVYPSDANFLLVKVTNAVELYRFLLTEQIVVRNRSNVTLCDECLRITVGTPEENAVLLAAFGKYEKSSVY
jgi:histidinol-phosphate aminotransferase